MLRQVAEGVFVHVSEFILSNAVVVRGRSGVLLVDPGVTGSELECLARDVRELGQPVVAGFSTHADWDHVLWHADLGAPPRYSTARCAAYMREQLSEPDAKDRMAEHLLETEVAGQVPMDLLGDLTGLPASTVELPWDGPRVRIVEHQGHAPGHGALVIEERGVLVAGDMLSDVLVPMFDFDAADPLSDYLTALELFDGVAGSVEVVVPGHGSVGVGDEVRGRIDQDRAYLHALRDGHDPSDPRLGPSAKPGWEWVSDIHTGQVAHLAQLSRRDS